MKIWTAGCFLFFAFSSAAAAENNGYAVPPEVSLPKRAAASLSDIWNGGRPELYLPVHTWHNRACYPSSKIDKYNESPWGAGIGKYVYDGTDARKALVFITFTDSNYHPQPLLLYTYQKLWSGDSDIFRFSLGYMAGFTTRKEWHWFPVPAALPILGFDIGRFSFENTYVPGLGTNGGNIWFAWSSWRF